MSENREYIPIDAIFDSTGTGPNLTPDYRQILNDVDIITGLDIMTEHEFILYGRDAIEAPARGDETEATHITIGMDQDSDDLERMIALIEVIKGRHDYKSRDDK